MKKSVKKILALVMAVMMLMTCFAVTASAVTDTTGVWDITNSGSNTTINKRLKTTVYDDLIFPDTLRYKSGSTTKTYTVNALNSKFFVNSKSFTQNAKYICLPTNLATIEQGTFTSNVSYVTTIEIPGTVTTSSDYFQGCSSLKEFIVNKNNPNLKAVDGVLYKGSYIQRFPAAKELAGENTTYEILDGTTRILTYAFYGVKKITDVKIPASVELIRGGAFCESSITGVHLENGTNFDPTTYQCYCGTNSTNKCADRLKWCIEDEAAAVNPVCGTPGHTAGIRCDITGEWLTGEEIPAVGKHEWTVTGMTAATCTEDAKRVFKCNLCGATKEEALVDSALGHTGGKATCMVLAVCERCGEAYGEKDLENGHSFTDYTTPISATCVTDAGIGASCNYGCGRVDVRYEEGTKLPHTESVSESKMPASCTKDGFHNIRITCTKCKTVIKDEKTVLTALGHKGGEATCIAQAVCGTCGEKYGELDNNNHKNVTIYEAVAATCTDTGLTEGKYCNDCKKTIVAQTVIGSFGHTGGEATCTEQAVCGTCGEKYGEALDHDIIIDEAVAPDCENTGLTEGQHCSRCDAEKVAQTVIPAKGHKEVTLTGKAPTCTEAGLTDGAKCSVCGEVFTAQSEIAPLGHTDADGDNICDNGGEKLPSPQDDCTHMCHRSGFMGFIWKIVRFFQKLFKLNPVCECGAFHY